MRTTQETVHLIAAAVGFTSFAALWLGTLWGTALRSGWARSRIRWVTMHGVHMHVTLFGLWLGIVHGITQLAAPDGKVGVLSLVVPFTNRADPVGVGMGVLALQLLIASALSVLVQRRLGFSRWRALHSLGYLAFTLVAAHMLISGSELASAPTRAAVVLAWGSVAVAGALTLPAVAALPKELLDRVGAGRRAEEVTVSVDPGRCASFGFCEHEAPGIFTLRSDQRLTYRSVVPADQADAALRASVVCPARAITLGRLPTAVVVRRPPADPPGNPPGNRDHGPAARPPQRRVPVEPVVRSAAAPAPPSALPPPGQPVGSRAGRETLTSVPPPPDEMADTGRHHLRPISGGRRIEGRR